MLSPRCEGCVHYDGMCAVGVCSSVRSDLRGKGIHVLPQWSGQLVPEYKEVGVGG